jgi:glutamine amidotransferase
MQLMTCGSSEGRHRGLAWIDAQTLRFEATEKALRVPHMGWNSVERMRSCVLTDELPEQSRFYFVHSYFVRCNDPADVLLTTQYGGQFHSGFQHANIFGVQFHPEKSHKFGMALLRNFAARVK